MSTLRRIERKAVLLNKVDKDGNLHIKKKDLTQRELEMFNKRSLAEERCPMMDEYVEMNIKNFNVQKPSEVINGYNSRTFLRRTKPSHCPVCSRVHDSVGAILDAVTGGEIWLKCPRADPSSGKNPRGVLVGRWFEGLQGGNPYVKSIRFYRSF